MIYFPMTSFLAAMYFFHKLLFRNFPLFILFMESFEFCHFFFFPLLSFFSKLWTLPFFHYTISIFDYCFPFFRFFRCILVYERKKLLLFLFHSFLPTFIHHMMVSLIKTILSTIPPI